MMSDTEILQWMDLIIADPEHPTLNTREAIIKDLVANAKKDKMEPEDLLICFRALELLKAEQLTIDAGIPV